LEEGRDGKADVVDLSGDLLPLTLLSSGCAPKASQVTTIAGGTGGFADSKGDAAQFDTPDAIVAGAEGTLYLRVFPTTATTKLNRMAQ
jgi:hypothetical protein